MTPSPSASAPRGRRSNATTPRSPGATCATCSPTTPDRGERLRAEAAGLYLDYSKNRITDETMRAAGPAGRGVRARASAGT